MKRNAFTLIEALIVIALIGIAAAILFPFFARTRDDRHHSCQSKLKQIGLGIAQYTQDYNDKYPAIIAGGEAIGWVSSLQPYLKSTQIFQCPKEKDSPKEPSSRKTGYTDYWFNQNMAEKSLEEVDAPSTLIALGDGNDGGDATDARYSIEALPPQWISDKNSPSYRHQEGANYGFADGHVKWSRPQDLQSTPNKYRFTLK